LVDDAELVPQPRHHGALRESGAGNPRGLGGDLADRLRTKAHADLRRRNDLSGLRRQYQVFIRIRGQLHYLWRAVDQHGVVLDILVQDRRNATAAKRFFKRLLAGLKFKPQRIITDGLRSYGAARREVLPWPWSRSSSSSRTSATGWRPTRCAPASTGSTRSGSS
jgi:putative transposase